MVLGYVLVVILREARTSSFEVTGDAVKRQRDGEGWATAIGVMHQKGMIVLSK